MKNDLFAFREFDQALGNTDSLWRSYSWSLFFRDKEEKENWSNKGDVSFKLLADMVQYMGMSPHMSLYELSKLHFDRLECAGCLYDLHLVVRPMVEIEGRDALNEFSVFACIEEEIIGILSGYVACSYDIAYFYNVITDELSRSVCARSWRVFADAAFPEFVKTFDLADEQIPEFLQDAVLSRIRDGLDTAKRFPHQCVLVSEIYVAESMRRCGVLTHMLGALDMMYGSNYDGVFYLTPRRNVHDPVRSPFRDMPFFRDYDMTDYDEQLNIDIAKYFGMDVIGEDRPIAILWANKRAA